MCSVNVLCQSVELFYKVFPVSIPVTHVTRNVTLVSVGEMESRVLCFADSVSELYYRFASHGAVKFENGHIHRTD